MTFLFRFSNGRRSAHVGVSADSLAVRDTPSTAIRNGIGVWGKIVGPLLCVAKETSVLQGHPGGRHAID